MKTIFIIITAVLLFTSCKKTVTELPPATQTGANTFGAKVNGLPWIPQGFGPLPANDILFTVQSGNDITINALNFSSAPNEKEFRIRIKGVTGPGTYLLNTDVVHPGTTASYAYYVKRNFTPQTEWITSSTNTGSVTITRMDAIHHIVSGTFQFTMQEVENSSAPLIVNEGRFDLRIQ